MTRRLTKSSGTRRSLCALLGAAALASGCGGGGGNGAGGGRGLSALGETFATKVIADPQQNIPLGVVAVPANWRFDSRVVWNYGYHSSPVALSSSAENPANAEAVHAFAAAEFFDLRPRGGNFRAGQNYGGMIYARPTAPLDTLIRFIRQHRGRQPDLTFMGSKDLPQLPAALNLPSGPNQHGLGVKVSYTLNGAPVEEEFYAVAFKVEIPYDGPQGRTWQINWGLAAPHSFRAPAGTLDKRRPVFAAIVKSFRPNPAWQARLVAVKVYLADLFNQQLKAGYDQIEAAGRLSRQISANNDAMLAAIDRQLASSRSTSTGGEARSAAAKFDDYVRGVTTVDDPYYGTSQRSSTKDFHWTDGYGNYRSSNDGTYDPNRTEVGNWQAMKAIK